MADELSTGTEYLRQSAMSYFADIFEKPPMAVGKPLDAELAWVPTFFFTVNDHITVACEISESPYPVVLNLRRRNIEDVLIPISVYCACPEEAYLVQQREVKDLIRDGFGLLTVDKDGKPQLRSACIPLVQQISQPVFKAEISSLPRKLKRRLAEAFDRYRQSPSGGVADLSEVIEGMVLRAGEEAVRKKWIDPKNAKPGYPTSTIKALQGANDAAPAAAVLGGVGFYISKYRTAAAHFPRSQKQAHTKYRECKHAFVDGLKMVCQFHDAMKNIKLGGLLPNR